MSVGSSLALDQMGHVAGKGSRPGTRSIKIVSPRCLRTIWFAMTARLRSLTGGKRFRIPDCLIDNREESWNVSTA